MTAAPNRGPDAAATANQTAWLMRTSEPVVTCCELEGTGRPTFTGRLGGEGEKGALRAQHSACSMKFEGEALTQLG